MFDTMTSVDRRHELENLRRSVAMLNQSSHGLSADEAYRLIVELQDVRERLDRLRRGLQALLDDTARDSG